MGLPTGKDAYQKGYEKGTLKGSSREEFYKWVGARPKVTFPLQDRSLHEELECRFNEGWEQKVIELVITPEERSWCQDFADKFEASCSFRADYFGRVIVLILLETEGSEIVRAISLIKQVTWKAIFDLPNGQLDFRTLGSFSSPEEALQETLDALRADIQMRQKFCNTLII